MWEHHDVEDALNALLGRLNETRALLGGEVALHPGAVHLGERIPRDVHRGAGGVRRSCDGRRIPVAPHERALVGLRTHERRDDESSSRESCLERPPEPPEEVQGEGACAAVEGGVR